MDIQQIIEKYNLKKANVCFDVDYQHAPEIAENVFPVGDDFPYEQVAKEFGVRLRRGKTGDNRYGGVDFLCYAWNSLITPDCPYYVSRRMEVCFKNDKPLFISLSDGV